MASNAPFIDDLPPFESAFALISAAKADTENLEADMQEFRDGHRSHIVQRPDPHTGENIVYIVYDRRIRLPLRQMASGVVANLRSALDQAMGDAAIQLGRPNSKGVYFPICESASDFEGEIERKCRNVHPALVDLCRSLEPYKHGKGESLWALSKFAGFGKHRRALPLFPSIWKIIFRGGTNLTPVGFVPYPNADNEIAIARGVSDRDVEIRVSYKIVVNSEALGFSFAGETSLGDLIEVVDSIVSGLKAETERALRSASP